jgi:predicted restriction endonuclease
MTLDDTSPNATTEVEERHLAERTLSELLEQYANRPQNKLPQRRSQLTLVYDRDPIVVTIRKKMSGFLCEVDGCQSHRFQTEGGDYFVEVHHLHPLAAGGPDI